MPFDESQRGLEAKAMPSGQMVEQLLLVVRIAGSEDSTPCVEQVHQSGYYVVATHQWLRHQGQERLEHHRIDREQPHL